MIEDVLLAMLEHGVHHIPVMDSRGRVMGVVTDTDMMGLERTDAFAYRTAIERARSAEGVSDELRRLPEIIRALVRADVDPVHVGHAVAVSIDAATRRLIDLTIGDLGDPPGPWAWLALGSQARHEQALGTDQDHALAFDLGEDPPKEAVAFFALLTHRVTDSLEAGGIPRCRGRVMAEDPAWRRSATGWAGEFRRWMTDLSVEGRTFTSIALDYRRVAGPLDIEPVLDSVIREAPGHPMFVKRLAHTALELRPPTGFFRDLVLESGGERAGTLDIKEGGIKPVTNLARTYAVSAGVSGNRTLRRLDDAARAGRIEQSLSPRPPGGVPAPLGCAARPSRAARRVGKAAGRSCGSGDAQPHRSERLEGSVPDDQARTRAPPPRDEPRYRMSDAPRRPPWASRRIHWSKAGFAALDFETTGLDANDTVISFGVVPVLDGRVALAGSVYRTVSMASELSAPSIVVHGLLPSDLADSPPIEEVLPVLRDALDGRFLLTWAAEVEAAFLAQLFGGAPARWLRRSVDVVGRAIRADRLEGG